MTYHDDAEVSDLTPKEVAALRALVKGLETITRDRFDGRSDLQNPIASQNSMTLSNQFSRAAQIGGQAS